MKLFSHRITATIGWKHKDKGHQTHTLTLSVRPELTFLQHLSSAHFFSYLACWSFVTPNGLICIIDSLKTL